MHINLFNIFISYFQLEYIQIFYTKLLFVSPPDDSLRLLTVSAHEREQHKLKQLLQINGPHAVSCHNSSGFHKIYAQVKKKDYKKIARGAGRALPFAKLIRVEYIGPHAGGRLGSEYLKVLLNSKYFLILSIIL